MTIIPEVKPPPPDVTNSSAVHGDFLDSEFRYSLFSTFYGIIFILGILANCYVLFVLQRIREAKAIGEIRIYMANLTIADLLFTCALPFWVDYYSRHGDWIYPDFLCRVTGSMFFINTYCAILFLCAISVNRYWAITRPLSAAASDRWQRGAIVSFTIWAVTLGMAVPQLLSPGSHMDEQNVTRCFEGYHRESDEEKQGVALTHFGIIAIFFVVFFLVVVCNLLIARTLLLRPPGARCGPVASTAAGKSLRAPASAKPRGVKRRALQMLCAVVGVFVLCFLPHHVIQGPWTLAVLEIGQGWGSVGWDLETRQALNDAHQITLLLMGLNCILDPVVYCFATRKFRRFIFAHMKKVAKGEACSSQTFTSQVSSQESRNHSQRSPGDMQPMQTLGNDGQIHFIRTEPR
ncbi:Platelet-activating factor receptor [Merluccius polli]|uniref:Platelet-activating factor receptor n=1 Tax=Merluccius polli TaxID=89951 RepID=A0AA47NQR1_MERPO|nr:Platelet-activating factor receptor [Merluccius polli]